MSRAAGWVTAGLLLALAVPGARADGAAPPGMVVYRAEAKVLSEHPEIARRNGKKIEINLRDGKKVTFTDTCPLEETTDTQDCKQQRVVNYDPTGDIVVVAVQRYESHKAIAIDRKSGAKIELSDMPHIAPDGLTLAVVKNDQENVEFIVQAIRHADGKFKIEGDNLDTEPCAFAAWNADGSFLIACADDAQQHFREKKVARGANGKWAATPTGRSLTNDAFNALLQQLYEDE